MFSCDFKFRSHIHKMVQKANKILGVINRIFKYLDPNIMRLLYTSLVRPHLDYASNIWNPYLLEDMRTIEKIQRRATKLIPSIKLKKDYLLLTYLVYNTIVSGWISL